MTSEGLKEWLQKSAEWTERESPCPSLEKNLEPNVLTWCETLLLKDNANNRKVDSCLFACYLDVQVEQENVL